MKYTNKMSTANNEPDFIVEDEILFGNDDDAYEQAQDDEIFSPDYD